MTRFCKVQRLLLRLQTPTREIPRAIPSRCLKGWHKDTCYIYQSIVVIAGDIIIQINIIFSARSKDIYSAFCLFFPPRYAIFYYSCSSITSIKSQSYSLSYRTTALSDLNSSGWIYIISYIKKTLLTEIYSVNYENKSKSNVALFIFKYIYIE